MSHDNPSLLCKRLEHFRVKIRSFHINRYIFLLQKSIQVPLKSHSKEGRETLGDHQTVQIPDLGTLLQVNTCLSYSLCELPLFLLVSRHSEFVPLG